VQLLDRDRLGAEPARDVAASRSLSSTNVIPPPFSPRCRAARHAALDVAEGGELGAGNAVRPAPVHQASPRRAKTTSATAAGSRSEKPSPTRIVRRPSARALRSAAALSCPWGESSRKRHSQVPGRKRLARTSCTGRARGPEEQLHDLLEAPAQDGERDGVRRAPAGEGHEAGVDRDVRAQERRRLGERRADGADVTRDGLAQAERAAQRSRPVSR